MFVLEDRVTARTNSGENEPEGNPNNTPEASTVVAGIVGKTAPSEWGQNITDQILALKVGAHKMLLALPRHVQHVCSIQPLNMS